MSEHRIPARTVRLGTVLELVTRAGQRVTTWDEARGWHVLATERAFEASPGRARLFLVPGKLGANGPSTDAGRVAFERWHKREPNAVAMLTELPERIGAPVGRALRLDYTSDKWRRRGSRDEYTHDFCERGGRPPRVYTDNPQAPRAFVLVGGSMSVSEAGIA